MFLLFFVAKCIRNIVKENGVNQLINPFSTCKGAKHGFRVGHRTNPETKGVNAWLMDHPTNPDYALMLLDTQGTGAEDKPSQV